MEVLQRQSQYQKPVIAAWIMTHADIDHYMCFITFAEKYLSNVKIERFIYNFPDPCKENQERIPALSGWDNMTKLPRFFEWVGRCNAPVYRAHTGQRYRISNAELEILSSPDDTFITPVESFNDISLVIKMRIEEQTILWCGDADFGMDNIYRPEMKYLIYDLSVQEFLMGGNGMYTLELPYRPRINGKKMLFERVGFWHKFVGAYSWFFDEMTKDNCHFTIINSTGVKAIIYVDLYFDDVANTIKNIKR